jgi:hypothetical protein
MIIVRNQRLWRERNRSGGSVKEGGTRSRVSPDMEEDLRFGRYEPAG